MITQKNNSLQYKLLKKEYDEVWFDVMENGYDTNGPYSNKVADFIKKLTGRKHVFMCVSGTSAIAIAIHALDLFNKKVAVSSFNYSACVNQYKALCRPEYVDCDQDCFIDIDQIPDDCDAVMLVNYFGNVIDYDRLGNFKGKIITDCSQAFGATYKGRPDGFFGDISTFAFGGNKTIGTRGFTGAIATDNDELAHKIDCIRNQGRFNEDKTIPVTEIGMNAKPQELQVGLIWKNLTYMDEWQKRRKEIFDKFANAVEGKPCRVMKARPYCESSYYKFTLDLNDRNGFMKFMHERGIDATVTHIDNWTDLWGDGKKMPNAEKLSKSTASLPVSPFFTNEQIDKITKAITEYFVKVDI